MGESVDERLVKQTKIIRWLLQMLADLAQGGAHPGPCDNLTDSSPCRQHMATYQQRVGRVREALSKLQLEYEGEKPPVYTLTGGDLTGG